LTCLGPRWHKPCSRHDHYSRPCLSGGRMEQGCFLRRDRDKQEFMKKIILMCAVAVGLSAAPAKALTLGADSVTLGAADINQVFVVAFDGNTASTPVAGLSALAAFQLTGYDTSLDQVTFNVLLRNTSALDSR